MNGWQRAGLVVSAITGLLLLSAVMAMVLFNAFKREPSTEDMVPRAHYEALMQLHEWTTASRYDERFALMAHRDRLLADSARYADSGAEECCEEYYAHLAQCPGVVPETLVLPLHWRWDDSLLWRDSLNWSPQ